MDLAEITQQSEPAYALRKCMKAKALLTARGEAVPLELYNNVVVLLYELKHPP